MASDKLGAIQKPVLNLDLDISENGKRRMESIEMNKEELERLISSLEAANKVSTHHCPGVCVCAAWWLVVWYSVYIFWITVMLCPTFSSSPPLSSSTLAYPPFPPPLH